MVCCPCGGFLVVFIPVLPVSRACLPGCLRYDYFISLSDDETVLLIDTWESQQALDDYHASDLMKKVAFLREKYDLHMKAERYVSDDMNDRDRAFIMRALCTIIAGHK